MNKIFSTVGFFLFSFNVHAGSLGDLTIGGAGCVNNSKTQKINLIAGSKDRYSIPIHIKLNKDATVSLGRKACNFRLPVVLNPDEKVSLMNLSQHVELEANKGSQVKTSLEVFFAALGKSKPIITEIKATDKSEKLSQVVRLDGVIAESACGNSTIVSGNLSAVASGSAGAVANLESLLITIQIAKCK
ncbi:MAG: hypothetical protein WA160_10250 [Pseudobdellovibrio sp.]